MSEPERKYERCDACGRPATAPCGGIDGKGLGCTFDPSQVPPPRNIHPKPYHILPGEPHPDSRT